MQRGNSKPLSPELAAELRTLEAMPERARRWLRFNPVFDTIEEAAEEKESYRVFAY